jgi:tRNA pseudouridine55 synthase
MLRSQTHVSRAGGVLILNKQVGCTSTVCCRRLRGIFDAVRIGHGGTLDPGASGVLPIALNGATRALRYIVMQHKVYRFTVRWGAETDTDDSSGLVVRRRSDNFSLTADDVEQVISNFRHRQILQVPPQYSALRINGERAHDIARRGDVAPLVARPVRIEDFYIEHHEPTATTFFARVSRGTYVRSLARDIGRELQVFGHVTRLHRSSVGDLTDSHSVTIDQLLSASDEERLRHILPLETILGMPTVVVNERDISRLANGNAVHVEVPDDMPRSRILAVNAIDRMPVAITELSEKWLKPLQVFVSGGGGQQQQKQQQQQLEQEQLAVEDDHEEQRSSSNNNNNSEGVELGKKKRFFFGRRGRRASDRQRHAAEQDALANHHDQQ